MHVNLNIIELLDVARKTNMHVNLLKLKRDGRGVTKITKQETFS